MANPRISEQSDAASASLPNTTPARRRNVQRTAAIIAACTVGVVGVGFGGLLVHAHFADSAPQSSIRVVKVKSVSFTPTTIAAPAQTIVAAASADEPVADDASIVEDMDHLEPDDPRWARKATGSRLHTGTGGDAGSAIAALAPVEALAPVAGALAQEDGADSVNTAAIRPDDTKPKKQAARPSVSGAAPTRMAVVSADVRLRADRNDNSPVIGVVPRGAEVGVVDCDGWCEVVFAGKRGFVYKKFVGGKPGQAKPAAAKGGGNTGLWIFGRNSANPADAATPDHSR